MKTALSGDRAASRCSIFAISSKHHQLTFQSSQIASNSGGGFSIALARELVNPALESAEHTVNLIQLRQWHNQSGKPPEPLFKTPTPNQTNTIQTLLDSVLKTLHLPLPLLNQTLTPVL